MCKKLHKVQKILTNYRMIKIIQTISQKEQIMNTKFLSTLTATAAATALLGAAAPAQAASFGIGGIAFEKNQEIIFTFKETYGRNQSSLGIYKVNNSIPSLVKSLFTETKRSDNGAANKYKGTLGNTVLGPGKVSFTFLANTIYTLGLDSLGYFKNVVYSTSALNSGGTQQAVFGNVSLGNALTLEETGTFQAAEQYKNGLNPLFNGGALISFDDSSNTNDKDFQDFTVTAEAVPEPMTMTGLALGLGGLVATRRHRGNKTAS
jgi:hypothetical protein